jgi:hypothetical protein
MRQPSYSPHRWRPACRWDERAGSGAANVLIGAISMDGPPVMGAGAGTARDAEKREKAHTRGPYATGPGWFGTTETVVETGFRVVGGTGFEPVTPTMSRSSKTNKNNG